MEISFADELNEQQLEAVTYMDGPCLVVAGAGSGKTRMLTYKIAYLLQHGFQPWTIMALTFTNKAAKEMKERIARLVGGDDVNGLWAGTFHSVFAKILRIEADAIGFRSDFTIYDTADSKSLIKKIIKELELDEKTYKPSLVANCISAAKNRLFDAQSYAEDKDFMEKDAHNNLSAVARIYKLYSQRCRQANAMDFDDLLLWTYKLLNLHEDIREKYRKRFQYLLVDEYQDTNLVQYHIVRLLTNAEGRVCVVGDDAQSIYAFRGADIGNILGFSKVFPNTKVFKLERNYRSTRNIVNAANSIIAHNQGRIPKNVYSELDDGEKIRIISAYTDIEESMKIVKEVLQLKKQRKVGYHDVAVLYRTNAQSRVLEDNFNKAGIPYRVYGGLSFYQRKEVKDFMAYLRLCCNPADEEALLRIINFPARGIGATTLKRVAEVARHADVGLWDVLSNLVYYDAGLSKRAMSNLLNFQGMMQRFISAAATTPPFDLAMQILEASGLKEDMLNERKAGGGVEAENRIENTRELLNSIHDFQQQSIEEGETPLLSEYLAQASLLTDQDHAETDTDFVTLMTVHAAKGLEFKAVFVSGMEDELFPTAIAKFSSKDMEEERRLFYVAVTRAKDYCYLTYAQNRRKYGQTEPALPSPFLDEIDSEYIQRSRNELPPMRSAAPKPYNAFARPKPTPYYNRPLAAPASRPTTWQRKVVTPPVAPPANASARACGFKAGDQVRHDRFGKGIVVSTEGSGDNARIAIDFGILGQKKLLLKFAKLTPIG